MAHPFSKSKKVQVKRWECQHCGRFNLTKRTRHSCNGTYQNQKHYKEVTVTLDIPVL